MPRPRAASDPLGEEAIRRCPEDDTVQSRTRSEAKGLEIVKGRRKKDKMEFLPSLPAVRYLSLTIEAAQGNRTGYTNRPREAPGLTETAPPKKYS